MNLGRAKLAVIALSIAIPYGAARRAQAQTPSDPPPQSTAALTSRVEDLEKELKELKSQLAAIKPSEAPTAAAAPAAATAVSTAPAAAPAGPTIGGLLGPTTISGFVDTYYGYNFNKPTGDTPLRNFDTKHNQVSLLDNLVLQLTTSLGCGLEGRVVIYDRFIWSTYIKYKALGYPVRAVSNLYLAPRPTRAVVLDVPVEKSLRVIDERVAHIHYSAEVLRAERVEYLAIAARRGYPVIDATDSFNLVQERIESHLQGFFPRWKR